MKKPEEPKKEKTSASRTEILIIDTDSNVDLLEELKDIRHLLKASHHKSLQLGFTAIAIALVGVMNTLKPGSWDRWLLLAVLLLVLLVFFIDWYFEPDPVLRKEKMKIP